MNSLSFNLRIDAKKKMDLLSNRKRNIDINWQFLKIYIYITREPIKQKITQKRRNQRKKKTPKKKLFFFYQINLITKKEPLMWEKNTHTKQNFFF
jgi:hypothetical protein